MGISKGCGFDGQNHSHLTDVPIKTSILIDQTGHAQLAGFGPPTIVRDPTNVMTLTTYPQGSSTRWMSPELIDPQQFGLQHCRPTESSDCYALGMVIYETISGNMPFHEDADLTAFVKVLQGRRPPPGAKFGEDLWEMLGRCWESQPSSRPSIRDVLQYLEVLSNSPEPCGRLIRRAFAPHELPSLVEAIVSSNDADNTIRSLVGDNAQTFVDVIDEARPTSARRESANYN
jgi:serine/threonine protein kinase